MAANNMKFGTRGIASSRKSCSTALLRVPCLVILWLTFCCSTSVRAEDADVAETPRPSRTNYASFQSVLRDQMHASSELPQEAPEAPKVSQWQEVLVGGEIAVCMALILRLLLPRLGKMLDKRSNSATALAEANAAIVHEKAVTDFATELQAEP